MGVYKAIIVDECGDEIVAGTYTIGNDLDEDYVEIWKDVKIGQVREQYPEARAVYMEDMSAMERRINVAVHDFFGDYDPWEDEDYDEEEDEEWEDVDPDEEIGNMACDSSGICGGRSCPQYYQCQV